MPYNEKQNQFVQLSGVLINILKIDTRDHIGNRDRQRSVKKIQYTTVPNYDLQDFILLKAIA